MVKLKELDRIIQLKYELSVLDDKIKEMDRLARIALDSDELVGEIILKMFDRGRFEKDMEEKRVMFDDEGSMVVNSATDAIDAADYYMRGFHPGGYPSRPPEKKIKDELTKSLEKPYNHEIAIEINQGLVARVMAVFLEHLMEKRNHIINNLNKLGVTI